MRPSMEWGLCQSSCLMARHRSGTYPKMTLQPQFYCETMSASDGALVCFVSRMLDKVANPLLIVVMNPLTKEYKVLPAPPSVSEVPPDMVQIIMDRETKCYKVVVVGKSNRGTGARLEKVYSSSTGLWSNTESVPDLVFGHHFRWKSHGRDDLTARRVGPCVYARREAELLKLGGGGGRRFRLPNLSEGILF